MHGLLRRAAAPNRQQTNGAAGFLFSGGRRVRLDAFSPPTPEHAAHGAALLTWGEGREGRADRGTCENSLKGRGCGGKGGGVTTTSCSSETLGGEQSEGRETATENCEKEAADAGLWSKPNTASPLRNYILTFLSKVFLDKPKLCDTC